MEATANWVAKQLAIWHTHLEKLNGDNIDNFVIIIMLIDIIDITVQICFVRVPILSSV